MQTIPHRFLDLTCDYPLDRIAPAGEILFIDIETTGFSARTSSLYMIGCLYYENGQYHTVQWFADSPDEEDQILDSFLRFLKPYRYLVHFNGLQFDLPYMTKKLEKYNLPFSFDAFENIDLYKRTAPLKQILSLNNLKQKSIEAFLQLDREDRYSGGELIRVYHEYVKSPTEYNCNLLLLHNFEDLKGMLLILPILSYSDLFCTPLKPDHARINSYEDMNGVPQRELLIDCTASCSVPVDFSYGANACRILCEGNHITLRAPLIHTCLKYFLPNHKEYYYLPLEDTAIHKSVAAYVDKAHRIPATQATCYTKKTGDFLPQWHSEFSPVFQSDHRSHDAYLSFEDTLLKDKTFLTNYAAEIMKMLYAK